MTGRVGKGDMYVIRTGNQESSVNKRIKVQESLTDQHWMLLTISVTISYPFICIDYMYSYM